MSTFRYIFLLLYLLFHVFLLLGSISTINKIRDSDFKFINGFIQNENLFLNSSNLITFTVIGLIFFGLNALMIWMDQNSRKKRLQAKDNEIVALKAKLFDLSPAASAAAKAPQAPEKNEEEQE